MSLRTVHKHMTRRLLLESGLRLFEEKGYVATTIDEISVGAGTTRTTFYLHFASKPELMLALIDEIDDLALGADVPRLAEALAGRDRPALRAWAARRMEQLPAITSHVRAVEQAASVEPEIAARVHRWHAEAVEAIASVLSQDQPASARRARALLGFAQVEYLTRRWPALETDRVREDLAEELARSLWGLLLGADGH